MKSLYIVDAINFLFRSYYAIGPMLNPKGESTNALYGFIRSLQKIIKDFSPTHLIAVFDGPDNKRQRLEIFPEYKGHRKGMPEDLVLQMEKALRYCTLSHTPFLAMPGVEADDVMASIATWADKKGVKTFLCTSDKDLCQLVSDHVFVINPHKDNLLIDRNKVEELFGVKPEQIVDLLAMTGDASDNIPGIEGIGPKSAASLLTAYGTLENILKHPEKVGGKKQKCIEEGRENAHLSRRLALLNTDLTVPNTEEFYLLKEPDRQPLSSFYHEEHFSTLLRELESSKPQEVDEEIIYTLVDDEESLQDLLRLLLKEKELCIDTETDQLRPMLARMVGVGLARRAKEAWYIPVNGKLGRERALAALKKLLECPHIRFFGHNIKYDLHVLQNENLPLPQLSFDTIIASYLLNPQNQRHNLDLLTLEHFGKVKISTESLIGKGKKQISMNDVPIEHVANYCCEDVDYTFRLKELFEKKLKSADLEKVFTTIEMPLIPILLKMEREGIYVDVTILHTMSKELAREIRDLEEEIFQMAGGSFNLKSPQQLSSVLFEKLQIKPLKKTTTGFSTSADVLESLAKEWPIVQKILSYRTLEKLRSTYVDSLPDEVLSTTGRIHCTFNQSVASTGRLSCQDPNLQNIPVRTFEGQKIRAAFKPEAPHTSFLSADYSQIELRLLAHMSEEPLLITAFMEGKDIHAATAAEVFGVPLQEVTKEMRNSAKAVNFGILYGQQAWGLSQSVGIDIKEAADFIKRYFAKYPKVQEFLHHCKESASKTGVAFTITGRQRPIPEIHSKNPMIRQAAERLAINTPLQGTAADLIKLAMIQVGALLEKKPSLGKLILQIHDELLFEAPDNSLEELSREVKQIMEHVFTLKVPLHVDFSFGKNWSEC